MKYFAFFCLFLPFYLCCEQTSWTIAKNEFIAHATISKSTISPLEDLVIDLQLTYPKEYKIDQEKLKSNLMRHSLLKPPPFVLKNVESKVSDASENNLSQKLSYSLHPQYAGNFSLTFLEIDFIPINQDKAPVILLSDIFDVKVSPLEPTAFFPFYPESLLPLSFSLLTKMDKANRSELIEEKNDMEAKRNVDLFQKKTFPWIEFIILFLLSLFWIAIKFFPLQPFQIYEKPEKRVEKARKKTLQALAGLQKESSSLPQRYQKLSKLFKVYLENAFQFKFRSNTTPELLNNLSQTGNLSSQEYESVSRLFLKSDLVKFASYSPSKEEFEEDIKEAEKFISQM